MELWCHVYVGCLLVEGALKPCLLVRYIGFAHYMKVGFILSAMPLGGLWTWCACDIQNYVSSCEWIFYVPWFAIVSLSCIFVSLSLKNYEGWLKRPYKLPKEENKWVHCMQEHGGHSVACLAEHSNSFSLSLSLSLSSLTRTHYLHFFFSFLFCFD